MSALVRVARSAAELEWDDWWVRACAWHIKPWWRRLFTRCPRLPGWHDRGLKPW